MSALTDEQTEAVRLILLAAMSEWSEENYAAGWLNGLEDRLHREAGRWEIVGRLVGWPIGYDAKDGWEPWDDASVRYKTAEFQVAHYGRVI